MSIQTQIALEKALEDRGFISVQRINDPTTLLITVYPGIPSELPLPEGTTIYKHDFQSAKNVGHATSAHKRVASEAALPSEQEGRAGIIDTLRAMASACITKTSAFMNARDFSGVSVIHNPHTDQVLVTKYVASQPVGTLFDSPSAINLQLVPVGPFSMAQFMRKETIDFHCGESLRPTRPETADKPAAVKVAETLNV